VEKLLGSGVTSHLDVEVVSHSKAALEVCVLSLLLTITSIETLSPLPQLSLGGVAGVQDGAGRGSSSQNSSLGWSGDLLCTPQLYFNIYLYICTPQ
jgi:hypothetical protein